MPTATNNDYNVQAEAARQYQRLVEFCTTHYLVDPSTGTAAFLCECQHPADCSVWRQHPDLDAVLADVMFSRSPPLSAELEAARDLFFQSCLQRAAAAVGMLVWIVVWGAFCWTGNCSSSDAKLFLVLGFATATMLVWQYCARPVAVRKTE